MAKIVFINPWSPDEEGVEWNQEYQTNYWRNPYLGLVQLATYLRQCGNEVTIIDCERDLLLEAFGNTRLLMKIVCSRINSLRPDVVGLTGMTYRWPQTCQILHALAPLKDELAFKLILGGRHASAEPELCFTQAPMLDAVFCGFSELPLKAYLSNVPLAQVPGIYYQDNGTVVNNPNELIQDLDTLPWPDWKMIDAPFYTHPNIRVHRSSGTPLRSLDTICSRGCSMACGFCSGADGKPRWHSVEYILDYLHWTQRSFGTNATIFQDTSLGNNKEFLVSLCEGLIRRKMHKKLIWTANMRANQIDPEIAHLMHIAGCRLVFIGFESGSDKVLKLMGKGCTRADNLACARILEEAGLPYWASFILGYPGETEEDVMETLQLINSINPTTGWVNSFFPSPGSPIYKRLKRDGIIKVETLDDLNDYGRTGYGKSNSGAWSAMPENVFRYYLIHMQSHFQAITEKGLSRTLEFTT